VVNRNDVWAGWEIDVTGSFPCTWERIFTALKIGFSALLSPTKQKQQQKTETFCSCSFHINLKDRCACLLRWTQTLAPRREPHFLGVYRWLAGSLRKTKKRSSHADPQKMRIERPPSLSMVGAVTESDEHASFMGQENRRKDKNKKEKHVPESPREGGAAETK